MSKLQKISFYLFAFFACFALFLPLVAQEEITLYGKILKNEASEEAATSLQLQELLPSHEKEAKARLIVLLKRSNEAQWENLEKYAGQEIKLRGSLDESDPDEPLPMKASYVEPLFQLIGRLSNNPPWNLEDLHVEFKEEPKGALFKGSKTFNVLNAKEFSELENLYDKKIAARGTTLIDENGQLSFNIWDARLLMDLECTLLEKKDDQGAVIAIELEDSLNQKRYLLNEEGLGKALAQIPGKRVSLCGYLESGEDGETFRALQYEIIEY